MIERPIVNNEECCNQNGFLHGSKGSCEIHKYKTDKWLTSWTKIPIIFVDPSSFQAYFKQLLAQFCCIVLEAQIDWGIG